MTRSPRRVLQVVRGMAPAGVETWLMHALREIDRRRVQMDFLVHTADRCAYDHEIQARQSRLFRCTEPLHSAAYAWHVREILDQHGPFDIIHSHVHHFSGYLLSLAKLCGIPVLIAHSHSDTAAADRHASWARRAYLKTMRSWIRRHATALVGASIPAGESLFGRGWTRDPRGRVLHCGLDFNRFPRGADREAARSDVRSAWSIGERELVIGHVGRLAAPKNHEFLLRIAAAVIRREPRARLLLVGDGPLRTRIARGARDLGIEGRVTFAGVQQEVPKFLAAMDVFVFPSLYEGLGLAFLEAQAAGLPCVVSDSVPEEADVVPELVQRASLECECGVWADAVLAASGNRRPRPAVSLAAMEESDFEIGRSLQGLYGVYAA